MGWNLIIQFLVLTTFVSGFIIFALYMVLIRTVDGAKQRLEKDAEAARQREAELNHKIKEADAELQQRKKELDLLERKMRQDMEEQSNKMKDELLQKARQEAEEIIIKAQNTRDQIRREVEKNVETKIVDYSAKIIGDVLSLKIKDELDKALINEFIERLNKVDLSKLGVDIKSADAITANPIPDTLMLSISSVFKEKLGRDIKLIAKVDPKTLGGVMLQFETLMLDGSLQAAVKEAAGLLKQQIEKQYTQ